MLFSLRVEDAMTDKEIIENLERDLKAVEKELKDTQKKFKHSEEWYAVRFARLRDFANTLPEDKKREYFSIVANGTGDPYEIPTYAQQMSILKWQLTEERKKNRSFLEVLIALEDIAVICGGSEADVIDPMKVVEAVATLRKRYNALV
jgi:hypothetical protein